MSHKSEIQKNPEKQPLKGYSLRDRLYSGLDYAARIIIIAGSLALPFQARVAHGSTAESFTPSGIEVVGPIATGEVPTVISNLNTEMSSPTNPNRNPNYMNSTTQGIAVVMESAAVTNYQTTYGVSVTTDMDAASISMRDDLATASIIPPSTDTTNDKKGVHNEFLLETNSASVSSEISNANQPDLFISQNQRFADGNVVFTGNLTSRLTDQTGKLWQEGARLFNSRYGDVSVLNMTTAMRNETPNTALRNPQQSQISVGGQFINRGRVETGATGLSLTNQWELRSRLFFNSLHDSKNAYRSFYVPMSEIRNVRFVLKPTDSAGNPRTFSTVVRYLPDATAGTFDTTKTMDISSIKPLTAISLGGRYL